MYMTHISPFPLQPTLNAVLYRMWWYGEDGQEARAVQKLPEASVRPVAEEQVGHFCLQYDTRATP